MKKTLSIILLLAILTPMVNAQSSKVLFYLKTDVKPETESKAVVASQSSSDAQGDNTVYAVVDKMPEFPGGQQALFRYLSENVKYPQVAADNGIQGRVICEFVVNADGSIVDVKVSRSGGDSSLDKEAVRVVKAMPKWNPGKQNGKPVRVQCTTQVRFSLY